MHTKAWYIVVASCSAALSLAAGGCGGGETTTGAAGGGTGGSGASTSQGGTGGAGATGGSAGAGATGGTGGSAGTGATGGTAGTGGAPGAPFTSKGATSYEAQTSVAADSKGGVVAVWLGFFADFSSGVGYSVSRDSGKHWTAPAVIMSPGGRLASNPVVVADSKGVFTLVWAGFRADGGPPDEHIYASQLDPQTETFATPAIASDDGTKTDLDFDAPSVKVDAADNLLVTYADFTGNGMGVPASLVLARSADGKSFQRTTITNDATFGNLASICLDTALGATAPLYLVHLGANGTVTLRRSKTQGMSWELLTTPAMMTLFQDVTCAAHGNDLWIAYASGTAPFMFGSDQPADSVQVMHSGDGGTTFDAPVTASMGMMGEQFLYPQLARSPSGKLAVVYYQGAVDGPGQFMLASSSNGATWATSPIAPAGTFTVDRTIASWLGGYVGLAATADKTFTTYAENSENKAHVRFAEISLP